MPGPSHPAKKVSSSTGSSTASRSLSCSKASLAPDSSRACFRPDMTLSANSLMPSSSSGKPGGRPWLASNRRGCPAFSGRATTSSSNGRVSSEWPFISFAPGPDSCISDEPPSCSSSLIVSGMCYSYPDFTGHDANFEPIIVASLLLRHLRTLLLIPANKLIEEFFLIRRIPSLAFDKLLKHGFELLRSLRRHGLNLCLCVGDQPPLGGLEALPALDGGADIHFAPLRTVAARLELINFREETFGEAAHHSEAFRLRRPTVDRHDR